MSTIRKDFEKKAGCMQFSYAREKSGKYKNDYVNAKWYGYCLGVGILKENPNKI
jgi:hypothetical protein